MSRKRIAMAAALAAGLALPGPAAADHRGTGFLAFLTGRQPVVVFRDAPGFVPYAPAPWQAEPRFAPDGMTGWTAPATSLPPQDRARAAALDHELGQALEEVRRSLSRHARPARAIPGLRPVPRPDTAGNTRAPKPLAPAVIEEEAVLGPPPPPAPFTGPAPKVTTLTAEDAVQHDAAAFSLVENPGALGLPALPDDRQYYRLNGDIVTLTPEASRALTYAALLDVLDR